MIHRVFQMCVDLLLLLAGVTGLSYEEINVILFCFIWPVLTMLLVITVVIQSITICRLRKR